MCSEYQFSLRHLFIATTLLAMCLGFGKWGYILYDNRIRPVTTHADLHRFLGKRVSLRGEYEQINDPACPFQLVWLRKYQFPIAVAKVCADGSPLPQIPDGATIAMTGRLAGPPSASFPINERSGWLGWYDTEDGRLVFRNKRDVRRSFDACITAEEVHQIPEQPLWLPP
jgi:hypothetical protein